MLDAQFRIQHPFRHEFIFASKRLSFNTRLVKVFVILNKLSVEFNR